MKEPPYKKELDTLKRKFSIPTGENLKKMLETEEGRKRYDARREKWQGFKKKWNIVFMVGDKPVFRKERSNKRKA